MDAFEKWWKDCDKIFTVHDLSLKLHFGEILEELARNTWRESAKQKDAEIDGLNAIIGQQDEIIENLEMSVKSFTDGNVDLVARERKRIVWMLNEWRRYHSLMPGTKLKHYTMCIDEILAHIEKESK